MRRTGSCPSSKRSTHQHKGSQEATALLTVFFAASKIIFEASKNFFERS
jgi:hypothetical protein